MVTDIVVFSRWSLEYFDLEDRLNSIGIVLFFLKKKNLLISCSGILSCTQVLFRYFSRKTKTVDY